MRASKTMQDRVLNHAKIKIHWHTEIVDAFGENNLLNGLQLKNLQTDEVNELKVKGLFYAIGHVPNTSLFQGQLELDDIGYIVVKPGTVQTSVEGVYAAGDVQDKEYRQAISAAGTGCMAALSVERWLSEHHLIQEYHQQISGDAEVVKEESSIPVNEENSFNPNNTRHYGGYALRKLFHESDRLIMVKYVSPTCGPCRTLKPILDKVVDEYDGRIHFVEIDIEVDPEIAKMGQVIGTPTIQFFKDRDLLAQMKGVKQKTDYRQAIEEYLSVKKS
jgi:thioredoxin reductase (NADPH)